MSEQFMSRAIKKINFGHIADSNNDQTETRDKPES